MSQYLNFFVYHDKTFVPIADYSRSTKVYEEVQAPYEKIREIKRNELEAVSARLRAGKDFANSQIKEFKKKINIISMANNPLEEKLEAINQVFEDIGWYEDEIKTLERYAVEMNFIANMTYNDDKIFAGVEISDPTEQDIVGDKQ